MLLRHGPMSSVAVWMMRSPGEDVDRNVGQRSPRFPFAIVFVELDDHYLVVAVAHLKRKPGYWLTRLGE